MIKISSPQDQLRSNRNLLALIGGSSVILGFLIWSASPFVMPNKEDRVQISLRYLSLVASGCCSVAAIVTGYQLQRITPLIKAIETAEKNDFISQLATSQWVQEQRYQSEAVTALQPSLQQPVAIPVTLQQQNSYNERNDGTARDNEVSNEPVTDSLTTATPSATDAAPDEGMEGYRPTYLAVTALQQQGVPDSDIIKDTLKQGGTNYPKGKQMLEALLMLGHSQGW